MSIQKRVRWTERIDGVLYDEDVDIYTSAKAVLDEDGSNLEDKLDTFVNSEVVGKLEDLTTEDKSNLASAIDEVKSVNDSHVEVVEDFKGYDNKLNGVNEYSYENINISTLPYNFLGIGGAVVLNEELHILGGAGADNNTKHYKYNGSVWESVSTLPYECYGTSAVVYNNQIHILGSQSNKTAHYKWNGSNWESVSTLPFYFFFGEAVVLNNEIHILGGNGDSNVSKKHYKWNGSTWSSVSTLPYSFDRGAIVAYNNQIHMMGGIENSTVYISHYKFNGTSWESVSTLPYNFYHGDAVVIDNEIYILGSGATDCKRMYYKYNGSTWSSIGTLPYDFQYGSAVVYRNSIHILRSANHYSVLQSFKITGYCKTNHIIELTTPSTPITDNLQAIDEGYRVTKGGYVEIAVEDLEGVVDSDDGNESVVKGLNKVFWLERNSIEYVNTSVSTLPYAFFDGDVAVYNNEIHMMGCNYSSSYGTSHYKYNGTSWERASYLPYSFTGEVVVYDNEMHIMGGYNSSTGYGHTKHYKWNGSSWESVSTLPYRFSSGSAVVYNNEIHIMGSDNSSLSKYHYKYNGSAWESVSTLPYNFYGGCAVVFDNEVHILGSHDSSYYTKHYKYNGSSWESVSTLPYSFNCGSAIVLNNEIHIMGSRNNSSYYKYHYCYNGSSWSSASTLPLNFYSGGAVVHRGEIHVLGGMTGNTNHYSLNTPPTISGYVKKDFTVYLPTSSSPITDNLTPTDEGYLVTDSGYVEIAVG